MPLEGSAYINWSSSLQFSSISHRMWYEHFTKCIQGAHKESQASFSSGGLLFMYHACLPPFPTLTQIHSLRDYMQLVYS